MEQWANQAERGAVAVTVPQPVAQIQIERDSLRVMTQEDIDRMSGNQ